MMTPALINISNRLETQYKSYLGTPSMMTPVLINISNILENTTHIKPWDSFREESGPQLC